MALPPNSLDSFSPVPPPPPPLSDGPRHPEPRADLLPPATSVPILPPTDAPGSIPEPSPTPMTAQTVTVIVAPTADPAKKPSRRLRWTGIGAVLGLAAGIGGALAYHAKLPGDFESKARVQVSGPAAAADADTQIAIFRSRAVLDRAAQRFDELRPFEMPPPKAEAARIAFLDKGLSVAPDAGEAGPGTTLQATFRGPHPADTPKYLRALVDAYRAELASRPAAAPAATPTPPPASPAPASPATRAERDRLTKELAALTEDDAPTIEKRIAASRAAADQLNGKQQGVERDLAVIRAAGASRNERLAAMAKLGVKADAVPIPVVSPEVQMAEESLRGLERKKSELGKRLGPEHRDMVALDEQIKFAQDRIAKAGATAPAGPDELERHRVKLEGDRAALAAQAGVIAAAIEADQKLVAQVTALRRRLDELANRPPDTQPKSNDPVEPPAAVAYAIQAVVPTTAGERVSPPMHRSLVPGSLLGIAVGALIGFIASFFGGTAARTPTRQLTPRVASAGPFVRRSSISVPIASGTRLGVPVFANVPTLRTDLPAEKKTTEGLSPLLVGFHRPSSVEAEVFRVARRELTNALRNPGHQVIPITSPGPGDGKSVVAANLAIALAQSGKRVILVDCDLRAPKVQELFRLGRLGDSLKSVMLAEVDLRMAVRECEVPNLFLLPAGRGPMDPLDLLTRPKFSELIAELKSSYEFVLLDAPSTLVEREFAVLADYSDGAVLVVRAGSDALSRSDRARGQILEAGAVVLGAVVNAAPTAAADPSLPPPEAAQPVASGERNA